MACCWPELIVLAANQWVCVVDDRESVAAMKREESVTFGLRVGRSADLIADSGRPADISASN